MYCVATNLHPPLPFYWVITLLLGRCNYCKPSLDTVTIFQFSPKYVPTHIWDTFEVRAHLPAHLRATHLVVSARKLLPLMKTESTALLRRARQTSVSWQQGYITPV